MKFKQAIAGATLTAMFAGLVPMAPALADGRASTRNIFLLGGAAATYLIIRHNHKVRAQRAEAARRQAAQERSASYSSPSYSSGSSSYGGGSSYQRSGYSGSGSSGYSSGYGGGSSAGSTTAALQRQIANQHRIIVQQRAALARARRHGTSMVDYGWGTL